MLRLLTVLVLLSFIGISLARNKTSKKCQGSILRSTPLKITVPVKYLVEGQPVKVSCSVEVTQNPHLRFAIYSGFYFTVLGDDDPTSVTTVSSSPSDPTKCSLSINSTRTLRMTEHLDDAMIACLNYAVAKDQEPLECGYDDKKCALSTPLKLSRSWPFLSLEGILFIALVAGWVVIIVPVVIYLLWVNTRDLIPSKMVDMGDSGNAHVMFAN